MQSTTFIGVDVASTEVVVATADSSSAPRTLANRRRALGAWLDTLAPDTCLGVESTGRYHELLLELACARALTVYLLNPRPLHHYAKAIHRGHKTDRLDAVLIARYLANEHTKLRPYRAPSALESELLKLHRRRAKLVAQRASARQSLADLQHLDDDVQSLLGAFDRLIAAIERRLQHLLLGDPQRADLAQRLRSLPGFGPLNANHFATVLARVDPHSADACVAFTGLDLRTRDSGCFHGQRKLTKHGSAESRRLIYLAAQAAARSDSHWNALYQRLLAKGRSRVAATVILARKLLTIAYHLYRHGGTYDPSLFAKNAGLAT